MCVPNFFPIGAETATCIGYTHRHTLSYIDIDSSLICVGSVHQVVILRVLCVFIPSLHLSFWLPIFSYSLTSMFYTFLCSTVPLSSRIHSPPCSTPSSAVLFLCLLVFTHLHVLHLPLQYSSSVFSYSLTSMFYTFLCLLVFTHVHVLHLPLQYCSSVFSYSRTSMFYTFLCSTVPLSSRIHSPPCSTPSSAVLFLLSSHIHSPPCSTPSSAVLFLCLLIFTHLHVLHIPLQYCSSVFSYSLTSMFYTFLCSTVPLSSRIHSPPCSTPSSAVLFLCLLVFTHLHVLHLPLQYCSSVSSCSLTSMFYTFLYLLVLTHLHVLHLPLQYSSSVFSYSLTSMFYTFLCSTLIPLLSVGECQQTLWAMFYS